MPTVGKLPSILFGSADPCCTCDGIYKNAIAAKCWHGRVGFRSHDIAFAGCKEECGSCAQFEEEQPVADDTHYLRIRREYTRTYTSTSRTNPEENFSLHFHLLNEFLIDRFSGIATLEECYIEAYQDHATSGITDLVSSLIDGEPNYAMWSVIVNCTQFSTYSAGILGTIDLNIANPAPFGTAMDVVDREILDDYVELTLERNTPSAGPGLADETDNVTLKISLLEEYTAEMFHGDLTTLLNEWPFSDDTHYPWRSGSNCTEGPIVTYNETTPQDPDHPGGGSASVTTDCDWTDSNAATYDGSIIGGADSLATGQTWDDGPTYVGIGVGAWYLQPVEEVAQQAHTAWMCKWVERKVELPAHNWARPCGDDNVTTNCEDPPVTLWPSVPACTDPSISAWNDTTPQGDFVVLEWQYNFRDIAENDRLREQYADCSGDCPQATNPDPLRANQETWGMPREISSVTCSQENGDTGDVLLISPDPGADNLAGTVQIFAWPDISEIKIDGRYGSRWQRYVKQQMDDPLYPFHTFYYPFTETGEPLGYCPDLAGSPGGEGTPPLEEARCSVPSGAPALPTGFYVGCLSIAELDVETAPTGYPQMICAPTEVAPERFNILPCPPLD